MRGTQTVEDSGFCVIQIWQSQNNLATGWFPVPLAHVCGLRAADMHKLEQPPFQCRGFDERTGDDAPVVAFVKYRIV
jgi:hypothetical protein